MDGQIQPHCINYDERIGFARALRDNVDVVVEELEVIQVECEMMDDAPAARFFQALGGLVRTFTSAYLCHPQGRRSPSSLRPL